MPQTQRQYMKTHVSRHIMPFTFLKKRFHRHDFRRVFLRLRKHKSQKLISPPIEAGDATENETGDFTFLPGQNGGEHNCEHGESYELGEHNSEHGESYELGEHNSEHGESYELGEHNSEHGESYELGEHNSEHGESYEISGENSCESNYNSCEARENSSGDFFEEYEPNEYDSFEYPLYGSELSLHAGSEYFETNLNHAPIIEVRTPELAESPVSESSRESETTLSTSPTLQYLSSLSSTAKSIIPKVQEALGSVYQASGAFIAEFYRNTSSEKIVRDVVQLHRMITRSGAPLSDVNAAAFSPQRLDITVTKLQSGVDYRLSQNSLSIKTRIALLESYSKDVSDRKED